MPGIYNFIAPIWMDANGGTATPFASLLVQTPLVVTPYLPLLNAMQAVSACTMIGVIVQTGAAYSGTPSGPSSHPLATDQLRIQMANTRNGYIAIPGPIDAIFEADTTTLNTSNSLVTALDTQIKAICGATYGSAWTTLVGGVRRVVQYGAGGDE